MKLPENGKFKREELLELMTEAAVEAYRSIQAGPQFTMIRRDRRDRSKT